MIMRNENPLKIEQHVTFDVGHVDRFLFLFLRKMFSQINIFLSPIYFLRRIEYFFIQYQS